MNPGDIVVWWRVRPDHPLVVGPGRPVIGVVRRVGRGLAEVEEDGTALLVTAGDLVGELGPHVVGHVRPDGRPSWELAPEYVPELIRAVGDVVGAWARGAHQGAEEFGDLVGGGISEKLDALAAAYRKVPARERG